MSVSLHDNGGTGSGGADTSGVQAFSITVNSVNDAPVAVDDEYTTAEDTALVVDSLGVLGNDTDPDGDSLGVDGSLGTPAHGTISGEWVGGFTYTPDPDFTGDDTFTYVAMDDLGGISNSATVTIHVTAANDAPVAADDTYTTAEDTFLFVDVPGLLGNDTDVDGPSLSVIDGTEASHGAVDFGADGQFYYTPDPNYSGSDSCTYTVSDGEYTDTAVININVTAVNDPPVAVDDEYTTAEDTALVVDSPGVLSNDTDPDGDSLGVDGSLGTPAHGTISGEWVGGFTYTPDPDFTGDDTFTYVAMDDPGGISNSATVTIHVTAVNDAPVAVDDSYTTAEDTFLFVDAPGVLANDTDADGPWLMVSDFTQADHGAVDFGADGQFYYTPDPNYSGPDSCTYTVLDGEFTDTATIYINVTSVNDPPVAVDDSATTPEDTAVTVTVLANDSDPDADTLSVTERDRSGERLGHRQRRQHHHLHAGRGLQRRRLLRLHDLRRQRRLRYRRPSSITVTSVNDAPYANDSATGTSEDQVLVMPTPGLLGLVTDRGLRSVHRITRGPAIEWRRYRERERELHVHAQCGLQRSRLVHLPRVGRHCVLEHSKHERRSLVRERRPGRRR